MKTLIDALVLVGLVYGILQFFAAVWHEARMLAFEWWRARNRHWVKTAGDAWARCHAPKHGGRMGMQPGATSGRVSPIHPKRPA